MNHTSTKSPIAAATVEMVSERLAKLSTLKRVPDEKPNTVVSTLVGPLRSGHVAKHKPQRRYLRGNGKELE